MNGKVNGGAYNSMNLSLYAYGANNPVKYVDLDGKSYTRGPGYYATKKAMGNTQEGLRMKADGSRYIAMRTAMFSAFVGTIQTPIAKGLSTISGIMSVLATANAHSLDMEIGVYQQEGLIADTITTFTEYVKNPIVEFIYDTLFSELAPIAFEYGEPDQ
jgi:hypothetical protein